MNECMPSSLIKGTKAELEGPPGLIEIINRHLDMIDRGGLSQLNLPETLMGPRLG